MDIDAKQAYLQSGPKLKRTVYIKLDIIDPDQNNNELTQNLKPLYAVCVSDGYWRKTNSKISLTLAPHATNKWRFRISSKYLWIDWFALIAHT